MNNFLPQGYEVPKAPSDYMKFEDGQNKLRFLTAPVMGYVYWTTDKKPVRSREPFEGTPSDARLEDGKFKPKHFWAAVVWNFADNRVQVLEIVQASIQEPILDLASNSDWGDPREYNITVNKKGKLLDTEYTVQPSPKTAVPAEAHAAFRETRINLEALFEGKDPFNTASGSQGGETMDSIRTEDNPYNGVERA